MPKRKQIFVSSRYISFIYDKLPFADEDYWWKVDPKETMKEWMIPPKVPMKKKKGEEASDDESNPGKKVKKIKLKYTTAEVKKAIEEDKDSLKDVEKLEEHLEEDIQKAEKKIKQ